MVLVSPGSDRLDGGDGLGNFGAVLHCFMSYRFAR